MGRMAHPTGFGTVIFDRDGTLARTLQQWIDGYRAAFARRDLGFSDDRIIADFLHEHHLVAARQPDLDFPVIAQEACAFVFAAVARVALYRGAVGLLAALRTQGMTLALVSSSPRRALERGLGAQGLAGLCRSIIAGDDGFGHKPDALPFTETLRRLGADAGQTLFICDSHVDVLAGQAAGCRTCLLRPDANRPFHDQARLDGLGADLRIAVLAEVVGLGHLRRHL